MPCSLAKEEQGTHLKEKGDGKLGGGEEKRVRRFGGSSGGQLWVGESSNTHDLGREFDPATARFLSIVVIHTMTKL